MTVSRLSYLNYDEIASRPETIALTAVQPLSARVAREGESGRMLPVEFTTASYFDVLGVTLQAGRAFTRLEDTPEHASPVAVLSDALWTSLFDRDPAAVGAALTVNGHRVSIVGIAPPGFQGLRRAAAETIWLPGVTLPILTDQPGRRADDRRAGGYYLFAARLAPGATWPQAHAELAALTGWLVEQHPAANGKFTYAAFHDHGPIDCTRF